MKPQPNEAKKYETVVVFDHMLGENAIKTESKKVQSLITSSGGADIKSDQWGRKEIPYISSRMADGFFICYTYEAGQSETVQNIESVLRITDGIKRFQTHRVNTKVRKFKGNPKAKSTTLGSDEDFGDIAEGDF